MPVAGGQEIADVPMSRLARAVDDVEALAGNPGS
jgi:hypothetical protein